MSTEFTRARALAEHHHYGQMYGEKPYMYHIDSVIASVKAKWGVYNTTILAVAALHDIIEDTDVTEGYLLQHFSKDIVRPVVALTKLDGEDYAMYIERVKGSHYSKEVKVHDTLCNLTESVMADSKSRVRKYTTQLQMLVS